MITLALVASLIAGADTLSSTTVGSVKLKAPTQWPAEQGEDGTKTWSSPDQKGAVSFYAGKLEKIRPASACVAALIEAVGKDGFENTSIGGQPAAKKVASDFVGDKEADKTDQNRVITTTVVGCDGKTKWLLTFTSRRDDAARFGPLLKRMLESIAYGKATE